MSGPNKILLVEDDEQIAELLSGALRDAGMVVRVAGDGIAMTAALHARPADLVILDIMLPGEDGLSLCRRLRAETNVPIMMVTAMGEETDRIVGLEIGADDYITKPFSAREVLARVRSLLRRAAYAPERKPQRPMCFDGWRVDPIRRQVHNPDNARIAMTTAEMDLLLAFCRNPGRILTREELLSLCHIGLAGPIERTVDVHVSRLRQKIEVAPKDPRLILTVRLGGYVFTPQVREA